MQQVVSYLSKPVVMHNLTSATFCEDDDVRDPNCDINNENDDEVATSLHTCSCRSTPLVECPFRATSSQYRLSI